MMSIVSSVEPPSTMMNSSPSNRWSSTERMARSMNRPWLSVGMMTVSLGMNPVSPHDDQSTSADGSVVSLASRGAAHLLIRQSLISLVSLAGVLALTGLLDPDQFALYGYAATVALLAPAVGDLGLGAGLIRNKQLADRHIEGSFALLFAFWVPVCIVGAATGSLLGVYG